MNSENDDKEEWKTPTQWTEISSDITANTIPPLTSKLHKGSSGRIGIVGGSARYTGAPYYAAMSALRVGCDLALVFCAEEASVPIKCYSPELMVSSVYEAKVFDQLNDDDSEVEEKERLIQNMVSEVSNYFKSLHALVIGPGLGRCPMVMEAAYRIAKEARKARVPLVLDADALFMFQKERYHDLLTSEYASEDVSAVVLTPNAMEYKRLLEAFATGENDESKFEEATRGLILVKKGLNDIITTTVREKNGGIISKNTMVCKEEGGLKRSGGLGDILAGTIGTFLAWNKILRSRGDQCGDVQEFEQIDQNRLVIACWMACCVTKKSTKKAFFAKKRSMTAPDVLDCLGSVIDELTSP